MHHFIYKTTNLVNGKYYIGVHSAYDLDDDYLGSGLALKEAIQKYGKENFKREILEFFDNSDDAYKKEMQIVNEAFLALEETYNLKIGGSGGYIGKEFYEKYSLQRQGYKHSTEVKDKIRQGKLGNKNPFYGKKHIGDKTRFAHDKNKRQVTIDDITYKSCTDASITLGVSKGLISKWIRLGKAIKHGG